MERLPTVAERTESADIVVLGTVTDVQGPMPVNQVATVQVEAYLKGEGGPEEVEISNFGEPSLCGSSVRVGERYIIFAQGESGSSSLGTHYGPWRDSAGETTRLTGQGNATAAPTTENIEEVMRVARQQAEPPTPTSLLPDTGDADTSSVGALILVLGVVLIIAGGILLLRIWGDQRPDSPVQ